MRNKTFVLILTVLSNFNSFGQENYKSQILILYPYQISNNPLSKEEILKENNNIWLDVKANAEASKYFDKADSLTYLRVTKNLDLINPKSIDIFNLTSFISYQYFSFHVNEAVSILLLDLRSNKNIAELRKIAEKYNSQYVLNFPNIEFSESEERKFANIQVQFYDRLSDTLLVNKNLKGEDTSNINFFFNCEGGTFACSIKNALMNCLEEIQFLVYFKSSNYKKPDGVIRSFELK